MGSDVLMLTQACLLTCSSCQHILYHNRNVYGRFLCYTSQCYTGVHVTKCYRWQLAAHLFPFYFNSRKVYTMNENGELAVLKELGFEIDDVQNVTEFVTTRKWDMVHSAVLNMPIIIVDASPITTSYGDAYVCTCIVNGEKKDILMGGKVLVQQLTEVMDNLPVRATVKKQGRYFTFS